MQVNDITAIDPNVDFTQILPIQQKRTIAFINHFVMNTVSFLNSFAQSCESRLMEFEYKLQGVEASLLILESQLASIPNLDVENEVVQSLPEDTAQVVENQEAIPETVAVTDEVTEDPQYKKFFKMLQFGVPAAAVKLKMQIEGLDPNKLDIHVARNNVTEIPEVPS